MEAAKMTERELLAASLATSLPAYRPGETVTALLHASTSLPDDVEMQEVEVMFGGVERVDTSWVSPSYRKEVPALNSDKRRVQRQVMQAKLQAATQGTFSDSNLRRFLIRFKLPPWLPPTFKGTAVRYSYYLEARISYFKYDEGVVAAATAAGQEVPRKGIAGSSVTRMTLQIWPTLDSPASRDSSAASTPRSEPSLSAAAAAFPKAAANAAFPAARPEELQIKCWEIGPGTALEDAVSHIAKLGKKAGGGAAAPFSPGQMRNRGSSHATIAGSDAGSEISIHDDHRPQQQQQEPGKSEAEASNGGSNGIAAAAAASSAGTAILTRQKSVSSSEAERPLPTPATVPALSAEAGGSGGSGLRSFALRIGDAPLARVCVHPPLLGPLQPGSSVAGTLEFPAPSGSAPALRCMQVSVMLETEESVDPACRPPGKGAAGGGVPLRRVLDEHVEVTADAACTHFVFSLPRDATPTFHTPLVALRWLLRFHFVAQRVGAAAGQLQSEQLTWVLPLAVVPPFALG